MKIQFTNRMKHSDDHRMQIGGTVVPPSVSPKQTLSTPLNRGIATNSLCAGARACAQATEKRTPMTEYECWTIDCNNCICWNNINKCCEHPFNHEYHQRVTAICEED